MDYHLGGKQVFNPNQFNYMNNYQIKQLPSEIYYPQIPGNDIYTTDPANNHTSANKSEIVSSENNQKKLSNNTFIAAAIGLVATGVGYAVFHKKINAKVGSLIGKFKNVPASINLPKVTNIPKNHDDFINNIKKTQIDENLVKLQNTNQQKYQQIADLWRDSDDQLTFYNHLTAQYNKLRLHPYKIDAKHNVKIENITGADNSLIKVKNQDNWHYRMPNNNVPVKTVERMSLNANANENLIKELDDYFYNKGVGYYKTPSDSTSWLDRHDSITMYFNQQITPEIENDLAKICQKYVRNTDDVLVGQKIIPGLTKVKEPSAADITDVMDKADKLNADLGKAVKSYFRNNNNGQISYKASAGQMKVIQDLIQDYAAVTV